MSKVHRFLKIIKICDADGTVSLTSLMMMTLIVRVACTSQLDWTTVSALFLGLANYNGKKMFARDLASKDVSDADKLQSLTNQVRELASLNNLKNLSR